MPTRAHETAASIGLLVLGTLFVCAWLVIDALSVCLNEAPNYATTFAQTAPLTLPPAHAILALLNRLVPTFVDSSGTCAPSAFARALAVASLVYLATLLWLEHSHVPRRLAMGTVLVVAIASQVSALAMPGLLSSDVLDYAAYGRVAAVHAANPYAVTPLQYPADPLAAYGAWKNVATVYGPLWTHVDATVARLIPSGDVVQIVYAYRGLALAAQMTNLALIWWLARAWIQLGLTWSEHSTAVAMFALNPLVVLELNANAHNEAVMLTFVLLAFALLTLAVRAGRSDGPLWLGALVSLTLGALVKFVPAAIGGIVLLVWLRRLQTPGRRIVRGVAMLALLGAIAVVVAWPWLESTAVLRPLLGIAAGGDRFKDGWQDAGAAWLAVRVLPPLGVPPEPPEIREGVSRAMAWGVTRALFAVYFAVELWALWRRSGVDLRDDLRAIAEVSGRMVLLVVVLLLTQVLAWYYIWPLAMATLVGWRTLLGKAAVAFSLAFLSAYYLREFEPYGVFYLPIYLGVALGLVALTSAVDLVARPTFERRATTSAS